LQNPRTFSRPRRLTVRTPGFHPGNRSSILREVTKKINPPQSGFFYDFQL
jgi:hypothetical protein